MNSNEYKKWYLVCAIFAVISLFFGGSLAYWQWTTNTEQRTNIVLTVTPTFMCEADGGGNISSEEKYLVPTDCTNSDYAIKREIKVTPTIYGDYSITMDLWLDVKSISTGLKNSNNFKYALTTDPNSCTNEVVKSGTFKGKNINDKVELFNYMGYNTTTTDTYYLYIWLDKAETSTSTMDQEFSLSLNGICTDAPEPETFIVYTEEDTTLRLYKRDEETSEISNSIDKYNFSTLDNSIDNYNINKIEDLTISEEDKVYIDLENVTYSNVNQLPWYEYKESITRVIFEDEIKPISMNYWFYGMTNVEYMDVSKIDTINVITMEGMFRSVGSNATDSFEIVGLDTWNVSNVTNMTNMFWNVGRNATTWNIGDISGWNVSNVETMDCMLRGAGYSATTWNIGDLSEWNVLNVINMGNMFQTAGGNATTWSIGDISEWDVSNVTNMGSMFGGAGEKATSWHLDLTNWDVSNVTNMSYMFEYSGSNSTKFELNLTNWDVSNVTTMYFMFRGAGGSATTWSIGDISEWNTSNVTNMAWMFNGAGYSSTTFSIADLSKWDTSNVTSMGFMFGGAGQKATSWHLDLSGWNVSKVTDYGGFNLNVASKITPPVWNTTS